MKTLEAHKDSHKEVSEPLSYWESNMDLLKKCRTCETEQANIVSHLDSGTNQY